MMAYHYDFTHYYTRLIIYTYTTYAPTAAKDVDMFTSYILF